MRVSTMIRFSPSEDPQDRLLDRVADYARRIEASGFPGIWVGDSLGRGRPTLDPLVELATLAAVTRRVELGIGVLQVPLRHPIELAHRVQSVQALSGNRLVLGVGSGSTKDDFDLLGYDYETRFRTLRSSLDIMRRAWRGEPADTGGTLSTWPGCEGGPPILIGAWRSHRWITLAAKEYQGWTPSGRYSSWDDLEAGMRVYREAGGTNAVLANCRRRSRQPARLRRTGEACRAGADRHAGRSASEAEAHAADRFRRGPARLPSRRARRHRAGARLPLTRTALGSAGGVGVRRVRVVVRRRVVVGRADCCRSAGCAGCCCALFGPVPRFIAASVSWSSCPVAFMLCCC